jgi:AcrR family transcriptional regulator
MAQARGSRGTRRTARRPELLAKDDLPRVPQQARSIENRRRLKTAALALFNEKGYARTSIDDIAVRADVAIGGFYLYFRSKQQMLASLMDDLLEVLAALNLDITVDARPREAVRGLLTRAFTRDLEFLGAYRAWQEAALADPELASREKAIRDWTQQRTLAAFQQLQQLPGARLDLDVGTLAKVMDRFFWTMLAEAQTLKKSELARWVDIACDVTYHALFTDAEDV